MTYLDVLVEYAHARLDDRVRDALYARGVSDEQISTYRIGHLDGNLPTLPLEAAEFLRWSKNGERVTDALVLPLTCPTGELRGLQFRYVSREKKGYQDFIPYKEEAVLFGLRQAMPSVWAGGEILLVEGAFDLFPLQRHFPAIVATLTARVPENLIPPLRRLVRRVWVGYDADPAGQAAMKQFARDYGKTFDVRFLTYPKVKVTGTAQYCKDPNELWEAWGDDQVGRFMKTAMSSHLMESANAQDVFGS